MMREESMLDATLGATAVASLIAVFLNFGSLIGHRGGLRRGNVRRRRQELTHAIVQRDAPDANRGRSFLDSRRDSRSSG